MKPIPHGGNPAERSTPVRAGRVAAASTSRLSLNPLGPPPGRNRRGASCASTAVGLSRDRVPEADRATRRPPWRRRRPRDRGGGFDRADRPDRAVAPRGPALHAYGAGEPGDAGLSRGRADLRRVPPRLVPERDRNETWTGHILGWRPGDVLLQWRPGSSGRDIPDNPTGRSWDRDRSADERRRLARPADRGRRDVPAVPPDEAGQTLVDAAATRENLFVLRSLTHVLRHARPCGSATPSRRPTW